MTTPWTRPASVPFPTVWRRCQGRVKGSDGKIPNFKIQDVTEDMHEEIVEMMVTIFLQDDLLTAMVNLTEDKVSVKEFEDLWRRTLKQNMALAILLDDDDETSKRRIVGVNVTGVTEKSNKITVDTFKGEKMREVMKFIHGYVLKDIDVFEYYGVDEYMSAVGLLVLPEFRGHGLSVEVIKARFDLGRAVALKATMTCFSPLAAQLAAKKAGMEIIHELLYDEYKVDGKMVFSNSKSKYYRVMGSKIE